MQRKLKPINNKTSIMYNPSNTNIEPSSNLLNKTLTGNLIRPHTSLSLIIVIAST